MLVSSYLYQFAQFVRPKHPSPVKANDFAPVKAKNFAVMHMDSSKQLVECSHYGRKQKKRMNTERLKILSCKIPASCKRCSEVGMVEEEEKTKQQQQKKKKKKPKKKDADHLWVCLECGQYYCDGADCVPHGHIRDHWRHTRHCWAANYNDPTLVHCFNCRHDVNIRIPDLLPPAPSGLLHTEEDWNWDSSEDDQDDKTTTKTSVDGDRWSAPVQGPFPPSDDNFEMNQSPSVSKDDMAISDSTSNQAEPDIPITGPSASLTQKDNAISVSAAKQTETYSYVIRGLRNVGNTCFFNVILQSLLAIDKLRCKFIGSDVWTGPLAVSLKQLFMETTSNNRRDVLDPEDLFTTVCKRWPLFMKGKMDDAEELLGRFLEGLQAEEAAARKVSGVASNVPMIFESLFLGQECGIVSSKGCTHRSRKPQHTLMFQLVIPTGRLSSVAQSGAHDDVHDSDTLISLEDCFSLYTKAEEPSWYCESCTAAERAKNSERKPVLEAGGQKEGEKGVYRTATRRLLITKAPEVLVVTFRRYRRVSDEKYEKLEGHIQFKEFLDIGPYRDEDQRCNETENKYRLLSVAEHKGDPNFGHYISYIRARSMAGGLHESNDSKSWFYASDAEIRKAHLSEVLGCEAYILCYERCPADAFQSSALVIGEECRRTDTELWPQRGGLFSEPIPLPPELEVWDQQLSQHRDKRREQKITMDNAMLLPKLWVFIDRFIPSGGELPYYRFILETMVHMGLRSGDLNISYSHLMSHSKELAMGICNGNARLQVMLLETARKYVQQLAIRLGVTERARDLMQKLELKFCGMPQMHEQWEQCFGTNLLRKMDVFGHSGRPVMVPLPDKCALVQSLIAHGVSNHRRGYSWEGDFGIDDIDVFDGKVVITKSPKSFVINPEISPEMIKATEKDFKSVATAVVKKFSRSNTYVPYLLPFITLLTEMHRYAHFWKKPALAEVLREWIQNFPFLKPPMARSNLMMGIFTASRSYNAGDTTERFMVVLEKAFEPWLSQMFGSKNQIVKHAFHYKDDDKQTLYYKSQLHFLFELLRHLTQHGTKKTFDTVPPACHGAVGAPAPRKQLVRLLDELEIAGAHDLEQQVVNALFKLLRAFAMDGMLKTVWECYKFCNYPYRE